MTAPAETILWTAVLGDGRAVCTLVRGCAGVDLHVAEHDVVVRREHYPDSSTAFERARQLRTEFERAGYSVQGPL